MGRPVTARRWKVDENLPPGAAALLGTVGHEACGVVDQRLGGHHDTEVVERFALGGRALVTLDIDFSNIRAQPPEVHAGFVVLRLASQDKARVLAALAALVPLLDRERLEGSLWIIDADRLRVWRPDE